MKTKIMLVCLMLCVSFVVQVQAEEKVGLLFTTFNTAKINWCSTAGVDLGKIGGYTYPMGIAEGGGCMYVTTINYWDNLSYLAKVSSADNSHLGYMLPTTGYQRFRDVAYVDGHVYVSDNGHGRLLAFEPDAGIEDLDPNTPSACQYATIPTGDIKGIASGAPNGEPAGTVYFTVAGSDSSGYLAKWQPGSDPVTLQTFAAGTLPMDAAAYGGNVYVSLYSGGKVVKCADNGTGTVTDFITARPHPYGLVARAGKLYLADNFTIWEYRISDAGLLNYWTPAPTDTPQFVTDRPGVVCASSVLGNLNPTVDCKVDFKDFAMMASNWLTEGVVVW